MSGENGSEGPQPSDQLREEAATWFARMRGEDAERHRPAFEQWLARGAVHRAAYNRIGEVFAAGKALKQSHRPRPVSAGRVAALSLAAVAIVAVSGWVWRTNASTTHAAGDHLVAAANIQHATPVGQMAMLRLTNGTTALLDTDTLLVGNVDGNARTIRLDRGRARFATREQHIGPAILVGGFRAQSSNGLYDLALGVDGGLDVRVLRGTLSIRSVAYAGAGNAPMLLGTGQRLYIDRSGAESGPSDLVDGDWPSRVLEVRSARLVDVLTRANRYSSRKIVLAAPSLAERRVSGRFRVDDPDQLASHLAAVLSLPLDRGSPGVIILGAPTKNLEPSLR